MPEIVGFKDFALTVGSDGFKAEIGGNIHFFIPEGGKATIFEGSSSEGFAREFFKPFPMNSRFGNSFGEAEIIADPGGTDFNVPFNLIDQAPSFLIPNLTLGYIEALEKSEEFIEGLKHAAEVKINKIDLPLGVDISVPEDSFIGSSSFRFTLEADVNFTEFKDDLDGNFVGFTSHFFENGLTQSFFVHYLDNDLWGTQELEDAKDQRLGEIEDLKILDKALFDALNPLFTAFENKAQAVDKAAIDFALSAFGTALSAASGLGAFRKAAEAVKAVEAGLDVIGLLDADDGFETTSSLANLEAAKFDAVANSIDLPSGQASFIKAFGAAANVADALITVKDLLELNKAVDLSDEAREIFREKAADQSAANAQLQDLQLGFSKFALYYGEGVRLGLHSPQSVIPSDALLFKARGVDRNGSNFDETFRGGDGDDSISARGGDDVLFGSAGADVLKGGGGADRLVGGQGDDQLKGGGGADTIRGGGGSDAIKGGGGSDIIKAGSGDDIVVGGGGNDRLNGGGGSDTLRGNGGDDTLKGNGGVDIFQFRTSDRNDTIIDFRQGQDKIQIQNGLNSFSALDIEQDGRDVLIGFGAGQVRVVTDTVGAFSEDDFIF